MADAKADVPDDAANDATVNVGRWRPVVRRVGVRFEKVTYTPVPNGKEVLVDVVARAVQGKLTALMGPSGCGKTSLLTLAAGMALPTSTVQGRVAFDVGAKLERTAAVPREDISFVFQDDMMFPNLTVRETLNFAARMKLLRQRADVSGTTRSEFAAENVGSLLTALGLAHVAESRVGDARVRGVSGGERKRLAVGVELTGPQPPPLLLMDEPTTGLDSASALSLMELLRDLTAAGHTVVASIHQPRTQAFEITDRLLLLYRGRVAYDGPTDDVVGHLEYALGRPIPPRTNTADWLMDVLTDSSDGDDATAVWARTKASSSLDDLIAEDTCGVLFKGAGGVDTDAGARGILDTACAAASEAALLFHRAVIQQRGNSLTVANLTSTAFAMLWTGMFWFNLADSSDTLYERKSLLFFILISQANGVVLASVNAFAGEGVILARDRAKRMYSMSTYYVAKTASDMINTTLLPLVYATVVYFACGLRRDEGGYRYVCFMGLFYLSVQVAQSVGLLFSACFPNVQMSLLLAPQITLSVLILGGFYLKYSNLPIFCRWMSWLSFARYSFTGMVLNEFEDRTFSRCVSACTANATAGSSDDALDVRRSGVSAQTCHGPNEPACTLAYGNDLIAEMDMHPASWPIGSPNVGACLLILMLYQLACRALAYVALLRKYR